MFDFFKRFFQSDPAHADLSAKAAQTALQSSTPPFLLDVRQASEYREAHIEGAVLIPLDQLARRLNELPSERQILCVCRSGARSAAACSQLREKGFTVRNINGGLLGWQMAGLPVVRGR